MITARVRMLEDADWTLVHNQRVHVHHGTAEVLARCALLEGGPLGPGDSGWVQFRLEEPLAVRVRDRFVIRAYSPVTTIGGGVIAEAAPPKRRRLDDQTRDDLDEILDGGPEEAVTALMRVAGWSGIARDSLSVHSGLAPGVIESALGALDPPSFLESARTFFGEDVRAEGERLVVEAVDRGHAAETLRPVVPLAEVRSAIPRWAPAHLADALIASLVAQGRLEAEEGGVRRPDFHPEPTDDQTEATERLEAILREGGLAPPLVEELPEGLAKRGDLRSLLRRLEQIGSVKQVADGFYVSSEALEAAAERVGKLLGGRQDLGPADFRDALPVSRKWLIPLLNYFDGKGVTIRTTGGRSVPSRA
jgi:selenocysteine-specific elongation factor